MSQSREFLTEPLDLEALPAPEPWGEGELGVEVAGGGLRLRGLSPGHEGALRLLLADAGTEGPLDRPVEVSVCRPPARAFRRPAGQGWRYTPELTFHPRRVAIVGLDLLGVLGWSPELGGSLWTPADGGDDFANAFVNFLRPLLAYRLLGDGGVLLHSAAIAVDGRAFLFYGPSGAGKTTLSRLALAAGADLLSDDANAVWPESGGWRVAGLPQTGELWERARGGASRPLAGLLRLRHGPEAERTELAAAQALASLWASAPYVNGDPHRSRDLGASLERLLHRLPTGELRFAKDRPFEDLLAALDRDDGVAR